MKHETRDLHPSTFATASLRARDGQFLARITARGYGARLAFILASLFCMAGTVLAAPGVELYHEDFENGLGDTPILLRDYVSASGITYMADPAYDGTNCNGGIVSFNSDPAGSAIAGCNTAGFNSVRSLAQSLGSLPGGPVDADDNHAVTAFTSTGTEPANAVIFETVSPVGLLSDNRFVTFSVDAAENACGSAHAQLKFYLLDGVTEIPTFTTPIDPCGGAGSSNVGTFTGDDAVLFTGNQLGIRLRNGQTSTSGNDFAFDNIRILDATPKLDKAFAPGPWNIGDSVPLTFTITNTDELAEKTGWLFTDTLSAGLTLAADGAVSTCAAADVTAVSGSNTIAITNGSIASGVASCTITVQVTSATEGTYSNGPANLAPMVGLDPPGPSDVTFGPPPPFASCDSRAFLFQGSPTDVIAIDLATGAPDPIGNDIHPNNLNAVGYNTLDDYIYGVAGTGSGPSLYRVGSDMSVQPLGWPAGLPGSTFIIGDFDDQGHYWLLGSAGSVWEIDLEPASPTYLELVGNQTTNTFGNFSGGADWAFNPVDGTFYRAPRNNSTNLLHLWRFDPATGVTTDLGAIGGIPATGANVGASYADADGFIYAGDNDSGNIYRIDPATVTGTLAANGPPSATNDGARCSGASLPIDFADAPDSYGTTLASDGPRHSIAGYDAVAHTALLMLGASIDAESDGQPGSTATGDDLAGVDDEDAFLVMPSVTQSQTDYNVSFPVHNSTGAPAEVTGWIDWNRNGTFEPAEGASAVVANGATSAALAWTGLNLAAAAPGVFPARLRIAPAGEIGVTEPTGVASAGEVEDYNVALNDLPPDYFLTCPVTTTPPAGAFTIRELWRSAGITVPVYQTPLVGDIYGDGHPVVVIGSNTDLVQGATIAGRVARDINIYRGSDGTLLDTIATPLYLWTGNSAVALSDVDGDGQGEILLKVARSAANDPADDGRLIAYRNDGSLMWVSDQRYDYDIARGGLGINVADFNADGVPEVFVGNQIFNAQTGARLASLTAADPSGCQYSSCIWGNTTAADLDGDGQLELVAGNQAYAVTIANPIGEAGNSLTLLQQADPLVLEVGDGWSAIADIDLDGAPDVVVVRTTDSAQSGPTAVFVWDPLTGVVKGLQTGFGSGGSQPFIGDIDGDGEPEIVLTTSNRLHAFDYVAGTGLVLKWTLNTSDGSALTTLAMFDFNSDGVSELVYRDDSNIRIINGNGATAVDLATLPCGSGTGTEMPVIADLDGSGEARIITACGDGSSNQGNVRVYASDSFAWAQTRPVWNQQGYFVTHVNDDLTIPAPQFPHWTAFSDPGNQCSSGTNRPLNSFQQQVTNLDPNTGCPVVCAPFDVAMVKTLTGEDGVVAGVAEPGEQLTWTITLTNSGGLDAANYAVTDTLDPNVTFVSADNGGALNGGNVEWTNLTVPAASSLTLTVIGEVVDPIPVGVTAIGNVVYETGTTPPDCSVSPLPPNCTETPTQPAALVGISKALTAESGTIPGMAEAGEQLTYSITLTNSGGADALNYAVTDALDPNVAFVSADNGGALNGTNVEWSGLTVPAGGNLVLTVAVQVVDPIPPLVTAIGNVAYETGATPPDCSVTPTPANCTSIPVPPTVGPVVSCSTDESIFNTAYDGAGGSLPPGSDDTFWEVGEGTPAGPGSVTSWIPAHVVGQAVPGWIVSPFGNADWISFYPDATHVGNVDHYYRYRFTLDAAVDPTTFALGIDFYVDNSVWEAYVNGQPQSGILPPGTLPQDPVDPYFYGGFSAGTQASLSLGSDWQTGVNELVIHVKSGPPRVGLLGQVTASPLCPLVSVAKALTAESGSIAGMAEPGEVLTWTITLTNPGGTDVVGYAVSDTLDPNVTFNAADNGGVEAAGVVTWSGLTVPANSDLVLTVSATVDAPIAPGVTEIGNVAYETGSTPPDCSVVPMPANCTSTPTPPSSGVTITKALSAESGVVSGFAEAGEQLSYTITLNNSGAVDVTPYAVTDALDPNVSFLSADNGGTPNGVDVEWSGLTVPAGGSLVLGVVVQVVDPIPPLVTAIGNVAYETGTPAPDCSVSPQPINCVEVPVIHVPLQACTADQVRATQRWWYFGKRAGIDFGVTGSTATPLLNPQIINTSEGSTVVTDIGGNLLFWSNGQTLYDRNQNPMPDGSGLLGNTSATQTVAAFPAIGVPGRYFVVTTSTFVQSAPNGQLYYSVVDMGLNGGLGNVVTGQKNIPLGLPDTASEGLTAVPNADGTGFWVLTYTNDSPDLIAYAFDDLGPVGGPVTSVLSTSNGNFYGSLYFSAQSNMLAQATGSDSGSGQLRVLDFDAATGIAHERYTWPAGQSGGALVYTADFSPSGDYLYMTRISGTGTLYRYRIAGAAAAADVVASEEVIGATGGPGGHVRRGPDGRMYVVGSVDSALLGVVNVPDDPLDPDFLPDSITLPVGSAVVFGLPQTVTGCPLPAGAFVTVAKALTAESGVIAGVAEAGEQLTYTITLTNLGTADATPYDVTDALDANVSFVSADNGGTPGVGTVQWNGLTVPAGGNLLLHVIVTVDDPIPAGVTAIGNVAYQTGSTPPDCSVTPRPANCTSTPVESSWTAVKTVTSPGPVRPGDTVNYQIVIINTGGGDLTGLVLDDDVSNVLDDATWNGDEAATSGTVSYAAPTLTWSGDLLAGASAIVTYSVSVDDPGTGDGVLVNSVTGPDNCPGSDCTTNTPIVHPPFQACTADEVRATERWWYYGERGVFDFGVTGTTMTPLVNPETIIADEGSTVVTDTAGNLLFWSNGLVVYDRNQDPMPNGSGLLGNSSATQTVAAFPAVGIPGRYFIVTTDTDVGSAPNGQLRYSVVDMSLNGGLGDVVIGQKNLDLGAPDTASEALTAVPNADGTGFWVLTYTNNAPELLAYAFDDIGPIGVATSTLSTNNGDFYGSLYFNAQLNLLAQATGVNTGAGQLRVLDFDAASGVAYERFTWPATTANGGTNLYTADFSPAGDYLYLTRIFGTGALYRYRIAGAATVGDIIASEEFVGPTGGGGGHVRRGADGRMYVVGIVGNDRMSIVNAPDDPLDPDYQVSSLSLPVGNETTFGLPQTVTGCPVPTAADVTIVKALAGESGVITGEAEAGEQLTYTITLTNSGGADATPYGVTDALDPNVAFFSADNGGVLNGANVEWTGLTVPGYGSLVLTVVVDVVDPIPDGVTTIGNVAYESGGVVPDCSVVPQPAGCVDIPTEANVTIAKTVADASGNGEAEPGEQLTYTITLSNTGGSDALNYGVTDPLDANVAFASADNGGTEAGGIVTWTGLTVPANGNLVLTVVVTVADPIPAGVSEIGNVAFEAGTPEPDCSITPQPANCADIPTEANVTIAKSVADASGNGEAESGEQLTYTITLTNAGGSDATNYGVTDPLDPNVAFLSADNGGTEAGGIVTWGGLTVPANGNLALTVIVTVADPIPVGVTEIGNVAFEAGTPEPDCSIAPQPANCADIPTEADVTIVKTVADASGNGIAEPGEQLTYTITLTNSGGSPATGYGVTDPLDPNVSFVSATNGGVHAGGIVTWSGLTVPASDNLVLTVIVTVDDPIPAGVTEIGNVAFETGTPEPDCSVVPQPAGCVDIPTEANVTLAKTVADASGNGQAEPGEQLTYTITLTNSGGADATGYGVTDPLDPNVAFVSADNGGTEAGGIVTWSGLTVPASGNLALTVIVTVTDPIPDGVTDIGNVAFETGTPEPDCDVSPQPANCVDIPTGASVTVSKALTGESIDPDGVAQPGEQLTYTLTVWNQGGTAAIGVLVNEWVPANTSFVGGTPTWTCAPGAPGGTACDSVVDVPAFAGGSPGMATLTFIIAVDDPLADGVTSVANAVALDDGTPPDCVALPTQPQCVVVPTVNLSLVKSVVSVEPTGPNTSRVLYRMVVTNTGGSDSVYTLTDTLGFTPDGVVFNGDAQVTTLDGTLNPALPGGVFTPANGVVVQLSDSLVTLPAGTSHTYDLLVPFAVVDNVQNGDCTGGAGNGLYNQAALSGSLDVTGGACAPVSGDQVHIALVKTVALDTDQNGNGLGDAGDVLRYDFEVSNTGMVPLSPVQLFDPRVAMLQCQMQTANGRNLRVLHADVDLLFASGFEAFDLGSLDPGDVVDCWATYVLTQTDVDRRRVTNTATTAGAGPNGQIASATSTAIFTAFP